MAFAVFADAPVDVAVIEVGMGGTWDATNVADGAVAVVTPIAIDHTRYLGNTVEEIAAEKAGIIKPGAVAVLAQQPAGAAEALLRRAAEVGATVAREGLEFGVTSRELAVGGQLLSVQGLRGHYQDLFLPLFGAYQAGNAACALAAVEAFAGQPAGPGDAQPLDEDLVREAFAADDLARAAGGRAAQPHGHRGLRAQPGRDGGQRGRGDRGVQLHRPDRRSSRSARTRTCRRSWTSSSRSSRAGGDGQLLVPVDGPGKLPSWPAAVFGPDRVRPADRLDDAIEIAVGLADEAVTDPRAAWAAPGCWSPAR